MIGIDWQSTVIMLTIEDYGKLNKTQRNNVKKAELEQLIDSQVALINNDPNELRNAINQAMDKKFEQFTRDFNTETKSLSDENIVLRKVILEQQKCLIQEKGRKNIQPRWCLQAVKKRTRLCQTLKH